MILGVTVIKMIPMHDPEWITMITAHDPKDHCDHDDHGV